MATRQQWRVIHALADSLEADLRREYLSAIERLRGRIGKLADAIARGDVSGVSALLAVTGELRAAADLVRRLTLEAMRVESVRLNGMGRVSTAFAVRNPLAVSVAERQAARFVTRVSAETRAAIRAVVGGGLGAGTPRQQVETRIRSLVGLTERQVTAVEKFRASGATPAAVERYATRLLRLRARTIARTETMAAANAGQQAAWQAAQRAGLLPLGATRQWITTPDDRLCPQCASVGGQVVGIDEPFRTPLGAVMNPPLHPNCRCAIALDVASLRGPVEQAA